MVFRIFSPKTNRCLSVRRPPAYRARYPAACGWSLRAARSNPPAAPGGPAGPGAASSAPRLTGIPPETAAPPSGTYPLAPIEPPARPPAPGRWSRDRAAIRIRTPAATRCSILHRGTSAPSENPGLLPPAAARPPAGSGCALCPKPGSPATSVPPTRPCRAPTAIPPAAGRPAAHFPAATPACDTSASIPRPSSPPAMRWRAGELPAPVVAEAVKLPARSPTCFGRFPAAPASLRPRVPLDAPARALRPAGRRQRQYGVHRRLRPRRAADIRPAAVPILLSDQFLNRHDSHRELAKIATNPRQPYTELITGGPGACAGGIAARPASRPPSARLLLESRGTFRYLLSSLHRASSSAVVYAHGGAAGRSAVYCRLPARSPLE